MKVVPLGTNGFFSSFNRQTACYAIPLQEKLIILDAGSGLFRLAEPIGRELLKNAKEIHLYLSHYHLDHTFGFYAAFKLLKGKKVTVFAETERKVFGDLAKEYFPIDFEKEYANFNWKKIGVGENKIDNYTVLVRKQYHRGSGSLALRFKFSAKGRSSSGRSLVYATDNEPTRESIEFAEDTKILLQEHYQSGEEILNKPNAKLEDHFDGKHVTTAGAATIAKEARVGKLALIHHFPFAENIKLAEQLKLARSIFQNTILAQDLKEIEF